MSKEVIAFVHEALEKGMPVALAILTESGENTPGVPGGMMAVDLEGHAEGTVGGGAAEARLITDMKKALEGGEAKGFPFAYSLKAEGGTGMVCGGDIEGFVSLLRPKNRLYVFGGGHVGRKVCEVGRSAGFAVTVIEDRPEVAEQLSGAQVVIADDFGESASKLPMDRDSYVVIVTRGHAYDLDVLRAVIGRGAAYIGMIGSRGKVRGIYERLASEGISKDSLEEVYAPVGFDIDDGTPGEIAVAIIAEVLQVKNGGRLRHCRDKLSEG